MRAPCQAQGRSWQRLHKDFRPHPRKTKDYDIMQELVLSLDERGRHGARTTMVKVHGNGGSQQENGSRWTTAVRDTRTNLIFVFKEGDNGREAKGQWSPKVKARMPRAWKCSYVCRLRVGGAWYGSQNFPASMFSAVDAGPTSVSSTFSAPTQSSCSLSHSQVLRGFLKSRENIWMRNSASP